MNARRPFVVAEPGLDGSGAQQRPVQAGAVCPTVVGRAAMAAR
jgi:hypothetical protein